MDFAKSKLMARLILASTSPRQLEPGVLGVELELMPADIDESSRGPRHRPKWRKLRLMPSSLGDGAS